MDTYRNIIDDPFPDNQDEIGQWTPMSYNEMKAQIQARNAEKVTAEQDSQMASMLTSILK